jgi:hypothetical protein
MTFLPVIPAKAGTQAHCETYMPAGWIPAFAGMTREARWRQDD